MLLQLFCFFLPFLPLCPVPLLPPAFSTPLSSCPWVVHISSLASPFPILFLTSPCLFYNHQLCFLFPVTLPPILPFLHLTDNSPRDLHFCDSIPVLGVCLVFVFVFQVQLLIVVSLLSFYCS